MSDHVTPPVSQACEAPAARPVSGTPRRILDLGTALPDDPGALQVLALSLDPVAEAADMRALLERAVRLAPDSAQAHFNLAATLQGADFFDEAIPHYRHALRLEPNHVGALNNLSDLLRRRGQAEEGWVLLQRLRAAGADITGLQLRYAKMAMDTRRFAEARLWFERALAQQPGDFAEWEAAMLSLLEGDFEAGWRQYERRFAVFDHKTLGVHTTYPFPEWNGEPLAGRRILLHREQGLGDMIMFASQLQGIIDEAEATHIAIQPPLVRLFAINFPRAKVWSSVITAELDEDPQPWLAVAGPIDVQLPIAGLGARRLPEGPPPPRPYLKAAPQDVAAWRRRLDELAPRADGVRRIGLAAGARRIPWNQDGRTNGERKSVPSIELAALSQIKGVQWVSLHDRELASILSHIPGLDVVDCSPWIDDLADTAALIEALDEVVSVDTVTAHLAGALGKRVRLLLWWNADWRWGVDRADSYWYPDVRIHRQPRPGDWAAVLRDLAEAFAEGDGKDSDRPEQAPRGPDHPIARRAQPKRRPSTVRPKIAAGSV